MDDIHRSNILNNLNELIRTTRYANLLRECYNKGILTTTMVNIIEDCPKFTESGKKLDHEQLLEECHKKLLIKITKRGPQAYQQLLNILNDLQYEEALRVLEGDNHPDGAFISISQKKVNRSAEKQTKVVQNDCPKLEEYKGKIIRKYNVQLAKQLHGGGNVGTYPMTSKNNRGILFMVNNIDFDNNKTSRRHGADKDSESLMCVFEQIGFKVFCYENLSQKNFFKLLQELIASDYVKNTECFVMALMTHGDTDENFLESVEFSDGSISKVNDIVEYFQNYNCTHLINKPKILIFPFCRGRIPDRGVYTKPRYTDHIIQTDNTTDTIPSTSDILICYASMPGFVSHRDREEGSWYIQELCKIMAKHAHDMDFEDIIKLVQSETIKSRTTCGSLQVGNYKNMGFNRKLYFNPGFYEDVDE